MKPEVGDWIMWRRAGTLVLGEVRYRVKNGYYPHDEDQSVTAFGTADDDAVLEIRKPNKEKDNG